MNRSVTVAIIDANSVTRRALIRRLQQISGVSVVGEAGDPREALKVARDQRADVVVMDMRRIDPDGAEFFGRLTRATPRAKIVILTAYVTERERADLKRAGAQAIVLKEIDTGALVRAIQKVAARAAAGKRRADA